jgi:hypothetical protein
MLLTNHELTHAALSQQIVTAMLDPKQEMQNKEAERGKERQGESRERHGKVRKSGDG